MRVRARFTKLGKVRFTSHRDVARMWERALRKAEVPVAYTGGFSPRPKLHFGLALGTAYESLAEYIDVDLDDERLGGRAADLAALALEVSEALPEGVDVTAAADLEPGADSLQQAVTSCSWRIEVEPVAADRLAHGVEAALRAPQLVVTRKRKGQAVTDDLRPLILSLAVLTSEGPQSALLAELGTQPRAVRPSELLAAVDADLVERSVCRLHQWITHDGERREPLRAAATAPRAPTLVTGR